jgi:hypothetical protein
MGYKLLGYAVWHGGKWYARRRFSDAPRNAAVAVLAGGMIVGGIVVARAVRSGGE